MTINFEYRGKRYFNGYKFKMKGVEYIDAQEYKLVRGKYPDPVRFKAEDLQHVDKYSSYYENGKSVPYFGPYTI